MTDSACCSGLYEKISPTPGTNQIAGFVEFRPLTSQKKDKSDFSLAERNEISEKCFSHTPLGPGYRSCDLSGGQLFLLRPPLLTLLRFFDKNTLAS